MDCDSIVGIEEYLKGGLAGLSQLRADRHARGYDPDSRCQLRSFIVLGRFLLDTCGNFSICHFDTMDRRMENDRTLPALDLEWVHKALPKVTTPGHVQAMLSGLVMASWAQALPGPDYRCPECGDTWTLDNAHDVVEHGYSANRVQRHRICHNLEMERSQSAEYAEIVRLSGASRDPLSRRAGDEG